MNVVGVLPSEDALTSTASRTLNPRDLIDGYPFTTGTISTITGRFSLFVAKKRSTDVMKMPGCSSTTNDCASGSPESMFSSGGSGGAGGAGGGGGGLLIIVVSTIKSALDIKFALALLVGILGMLLRFAVTSARFVPFEKSGST